MINLRKRGDLRDPIISMLASDPHPEVIAQRLGCHPAYVRKAKQRYRPQIAAKRLGLRAA
jgi:hypothetical protein